MLLLRARESLVPPFRAAVKAQGLTEQQWRVLRALVEYGELEMNVLAKLCCVLQPSASRITKNLNERGLVEKCKDAQDARRTLVEITSHGQALVTKLTPRIEQIYSELEKRIGTDLLDDYCVMLRSISAITNSRTCS